MAEDKINESPGANNAIHAEGLCCSVIAGTTDAIFICGLDGRLLLANPVFAALFEKSVDELVGCAIEELDLSELAGVITKENAVVLESKTSHTFEFVSATKKKTRIFLVTKGVHRDDKGRVQGVFGIMRDISERRAIERNIIDTSDKEKQRLGREMRENFCQHLVGISLLGNVLYEELSRAGIEQAKFAQQIAQLVKEVVSEVRAVEKGLSVTHLEQGEGLVEALEDLAEQARSKGQIQCTFRGPTLHQAIDPQTAMYLFRIAQEAVHNALAHSQARRLNIRLATTRDAVVLSVKDDGIGFSEKKLNHDLSARIGFPTMIHRSRAIGAKLEIKHLPRGGIEVVCTVPKRKFSDRRR